MKTFPDPSNSPAHQPRALSIDGPQAIAPVSSPVVRDWVYSFSRIEKLAVNLSWHPPSSHYTDCHPPSNPSSWMSLPFHPRGSSTSSVPFPFSKVFGCVVVLLPTGMILMASGQWAEHSFDLAKTHRIPRSARRYPAHRAQNVGPSRWSPLRQDLYLLLRWRRQPDNGFGVDALWHPEIALRWLLSKWVSFNLCGYQYLTATFGPGADGIVPPLDLSGATKLKDVEFWCTRPGIRWITTALLAAKSVCLRQITIHLRTAFSEVISREWQDLGHLLVRLWTSRSIIPKIQYTTGEVNGGRRYLVPDLLPELTGMRVVGCLGC